MSNSAQIISNLDCDALIQQIQRMDDLPRLQKVLFDFVRSSPQNEEALLRVLYEAPASLSEFHLDLINFTLMETIQSDQNLSAANTIKDFGFTLQGITKQFFKELVSADFFPELILTGKYSVIELPQALAKQLALPGSQTLQELNSLLEELSLRIHLENSKPYSQLSIEKERDRVLLRVVGPEEQLTIQSYTDQELKKFKSVVSSDNPQERYNSHYLDIGIKQIAIITHGNLRTEQTVQSLLKNLEKFCHSNICVTVYDDKEESSLREKIRSIACPKGIEVRYVGFQEREEKINALAQQLGTHRRSDIEAAIGRRTGAGGNRNFVALCEGKKNYLSLDDDMDAGVVTLIKGSKKVIDVDLLTIASRHIRPQATIASDFRSVGHLDNAGIGNIGAFLANTELSTPVDSWTRHYNSIGAKIWDSNRENTSNLIYDVRESNILSGAAVSFPSDYNGLIARQPTFVATANTGRNEDVFLSVIPSSILELVGFPAGIYRTVASAVQHNREVSFRNTDLVKNVMEEKTGQFLACIVSYLIKTTPQVQNAIVTGKNAFSNIDSVFVELSKAIKKLTARSDQELIQMLFPLMADALMYEIVISDIKDLYKMHKHKGILTNPHPELDARKQQEFLAWQTNATRKDSYMKLIKDLRNTFRDFFGPELDKIPQMSPQSLDLLIFKRMVQNSRDALQKYGATLGVWSEMLKASDN